MEYYAWSNGLILPKKEVDEATKRVRELRHKVDSGKIDLSKYEDMAEEF